MAIQESIYEKLLTAIKENKLRDLTKILSTINSNDISNDQGYALLVNAKRQINPIIERLLTSHLHAEVFEKYDAVEKTKSLQSELVYAVKKGNLTEVQKLITIPKVSIYPRDKESSYTMLMWAARYGHTEIIALFLPLLSHKAFHALDVHDKVTALMLASQHGHLEAVKVLLTFPKIQVNQHNNDHMTALMFAAWNGHAEIVSALLKAGATINQINNEGDSALIFSSMRGHLDATRALLEFKPSIDNANNYGNTALLLAANNGHAPIVSILVDAGANLNIQNTPARNTAIILAAMKSRADIVSILITAGADINITNQNHHTSLSLAVTQNHFPIIEAIMHNIGSAYSTKTLDSALNHAASDKKIDVNIFFRIIAGMSFLETGRALQHYPKLKPIFNQYHSAVFALKEDVFYQVYSINKKRYESTLQILSYLRPKWCPESLFKFICQEQREKVTHLIENRSQIKPQTQNKITEDLSAPKTIPLQQPPKIQTVPNNNLPSNNPPHLPQYSGLFSSIKALFQEFKKHPTYYLFSAVTRVTIAAIVGYALFYGLTGLLASSYLAPNLVSLSQAMPKISMAISLLASAFAATKLANAFLISFFGEFKISTTLFQGLKSNDYATICQTTRKKGLLGHLGFPNPYRTTLNDITSELEQEFNRLNKYKPNELSKSKTFALAYTKKLVEASENSWVFNTDEKAEVKKEPYLSASAKY